MTTDSGVRGRRLRLWLPIQACQFVATELGVAFGFRILPAEVVKVELWRTDRCAGDLAQPQSGLLRSRRLNPYDVSTGTSRLPLGRKRNLLARRQSVEGAGTEDTVTCRVPIQLFGDRDPTDVACLFDAKPASEEESALLSGTSSLFNEFSPRVTASKKFIKDKISAFFCCRTCWTFVTAVRSQLTAGGIVDSICKKENEHVLF
jgi:hypothetical protein